MLEIRILSGARAGQVDRFEKAIVVIGRHAVVDLRFSPDQDLDVSGRHAEIRLIDGRYMLHDVGSTNGTLVNGKKIETPTALGDGDHVRFGVVGPEIEVRTTASTSPSQTRVRSTEERIAVAVNQQTAGLKRYMLAGLVVLLAGAGGLWYWGNLQSQRHSDEVQRRLAVSDSLRAILQGGSMGDTALLSRMVVQIDLPSIHRINSPAVALIVSKIGDKSYAGTGFAITSEGLIVTNRHNVRDSVGAMASKLAVKFTDSGDWLPAHVVKVQEAGEDLALIQMDRGGPFPVVQGVSSGAADAMEGNSVVTIGFPLGYDTPMEGQGNDFIAKSTLNPGTVSKRTSTVLQIDSYAAHGSSGSPVFDRRGRVVGVVYGGAAEGGGRIVYAVPADKVAAFLTPEYKSIVRE
ncbi:MAG TPA: trypsin-like peptidase domain-containing protein [Gemmatimonadaceae bacterium]|nr:trypsin-like peptidase domain-containing protein [Gemmatimonadaceae bacterium]